MKEHYMWTQKEYVWTNDDPEKPKDYIVCPFYRYEPKKDPHIPGRLATSPSCNSMIFYKDFYVTIDFI